MKFKLYILMITIITSISLIACGDSTAMDNMKGDMQRLGSNATQNGDNTGIDLTKGTAFIGNIPTNNMSRSNIGNGNINVNPVKLVTNMPTMESAIVQSTMADSCQVIKGDGVAYIGYTCDQTTDQAFVQSQIVNICKELDTSVQTVYCVPNESVIREAKTKINSGVYNEQDLVNNIKLNFESKIYE